jgi:membrane-bound metal-dependent hydrolase YbcI (DUF457 family)
MNGKILINELLFMPLAVTHVILTIIVLDLYRDYVAIHKKYFTLWTIFIGGVAGVLSDLDIILYNLFLQFNINIPLLAHGGITHTPVFAAIFLVPFFILWTKKKHKLAVIFLVISFGIFMHIFLDYFVGGGDVHGIMFFYPFSTDRYTISFLNNYQDWISYAGLDAIILLLWLFHEEWKHKIRDFI